MSVDPVDNARRVLRRCPECRLLFEAVEGTAACIVCGASVDGLALPLSPVEPVPADVLELEPTARVTVTD